MAVSLSHLNGSSKEHQVNFVTEEYCLNVSSCFPPTLLFVVTPETFILSPTFNFVISELCSRQPTSLISPVSSPTIVSASGTLSALLVFTSVSFGVCKTMASRKRGSREELVSLIFDSSIDTWGKEESSSTSLM